ncbi:S49 family peptidase [Wenzhouxiangella sp. AB-CW3]|uniref:S49 family peptidase n=1 Tax=Wenzhouxiangella sp. AB-CW3 TaxID=2771012 RepID=UPI00168B3522|nr:S49 family peptidase [Wenzhouxiangella sp. AB-CW3]QOC21810.1 S49 family peptidase [Wenzhouxiangella sp. AB-CW3]
MLHWLNRFFFTIGFLVVLAVVIGLSLFLLTRDQVPENGVLLIDFEQTAIESIPPDALAGMLLGEQLKVRDLVDALDAAATDDRIHAVVARIGSGHPMAMSQEFRQAIIRFRESGKPAVAFAETIGEVGPGNTGYYLATAFDEIYLQESGDIGLIGLSVQSMFLRGMLDKLELEPRWDNRYEYKNAQNMIVEREYTDAHREAEYAVANSMFDQMVEDIVADRDLSPEELRELIDRGPFYGIEAVEAGLIDGLAFRDEVFAQLEERLGQDFETLGPRRYLKINGRPHAKGTGVALIFGDGAVVRGSSGFDPITGMTFMGSDTVTGAFREAIEDDNIRAIVLRVDSGGGSYVASDAIWRMTQLAREAGKPVVVSLGNVAASGGYYVAMGADRIIAQPGTITGSIGVLAGKLLTESFWEERLGITWDRIETSANAGMYVGLEDYTEHGWARHQAWLDRVYEDFTGKAAAGRGMSREAMHELAKGRIWSGRQALESGLIDQVGGFGEAWAAVRELLELEVDAPLHVQGFPAELPWYQRLMEGSQEPEVSASVQAAVEVLEQVQPVARALRRAGVLDQPHALEMPHEIDIR